MRNVRTFIDGTGARVLLLVGAWVAIAAAACQCPKSGEEVRGFEADLKGKNDLLLDMHIAKPLLDIHRAGSGDSDGGAGDSLELNKVPDGAGDVVDFEQHDFDLGYMDAPPELDVCVSNCAGKECGDDGCGQACPYLCTDVQECGAEGKCEDVIKPVWLAELHSPGGLRITDGRARPGGGFVLAGLVQGEGLSYNGEVVLDESMGNAFIAVISKAGALEWLTRYPDRKKISISWTGFRIRPIAPLADGGVAFAGNSVYGPYDVGCGEHNYPGLGLVAVVSEDGCRWSQPFYAYGNITTPLSVVHNDGAVYSAGEALEPCVDLGGGVECAPQDLPSNNFLFVVKYSATTGEHLWTRWIEGVGFVPWGNNQPLALSPSGVTFGSVVVHDDPIRFSETLSLKPGEEDFGFLVNYSPSGEVQWATGYPQVAFDWMVYTPGHGYISSGQDNKAPVAPDGTLLADTLLPAWLINRYDEQGLLNYQGQIVGESSSTHVFDLNAAPDGDVHMALAQEYNKEGSYFPIAFLRLSPPYKESSWRVVLEGVGWHNQPSYEETVFDANGEETYMAFLLDEHELTIDGKALPTDKEGSTIVVTRIMQ